MKDIDLTIGIATCGRPRVLRRCINSIKKHIQLPLKILIVDNVGAFTNKTEVKAKNFIKGDNIQIIEIDDRKIGCCESNNLVLENCDTQYLMYLDDDVYFHEPGTAEALLEMLRYLENIYERVGVGAAWFDKFYNNFRHCAMKYIFGYIDKKLYVKKLPIDYRFARQFGFEWTETDELLHTMIFNVNTLRKLDIKWDNNFQWKGDRLDFFLTLKQHNFALYQYNTKYVIHDPKPFKYGSLSVSYTHLTLPTKA